MCNNNGNNRQHNGQKSDDDKEGKDDSTTGKQESQVNTGSYEEDDVYGDYAIMQGTAAQYEPGFDDAAHNLREAVMRAILGQGPPAFDSATTQFRTAKPTYEKVMKITSMINEMNKDPSLCGTLTLVTSTSNVKAKTN